MEYGYDGTGRLSTRVDLLRNDVVRFLYANIEKPSVLTHVYNVTSGSFFDCLTFFKLISLPEIKFCFLKGNNVTYFNIGI